MPSAAGSPVLTRPDGSPLRVLVVDDEVDLTRLVLEAVADTREVGPRHHRLLDLPEAPVVVRGDEHRLHQALTNLLTNARRHTPEGTTVTVGLCRDSGAGGVRLTVHDDGPGLPADLVPGAFERFTRGDTARTRAAGGAGLGLSLVRAIAVAHGGRAEVASPRRHHVHAAPARRTLDLNRIGITCRVGGPRSDQRRRKHLCSP